MLKDPVGTDEACTLTWRKNDTTVIGSVSFVEIAVDATDLSAAGDTFNLVTSTAMAAGDYVTITATTDTNDAKCTGTCDCGTAANVDLWVKTWYSFD